MTSAGGEVISDLRKNAHAVIIGINKYRDQKIPDLSYACADAKGVYDILVDPDLGRIAPENVILLLDDKATERAIKTELAIELPKRAAEDDLVYIYFAGHGSPVVDPKTTSSDGVEKYLIPSDAEIDSLRATGISMDDIHKCFGYIESKQVLFFIDSCYSGNAGGRTFSDPKYQKRATINDDFLKELAGEGRLVVTACDVNELSLEIEEMGHGLFTYYLMEGLKGVADKDQDGLVTVPELYEYTFENVSQQAQKMGGSMHPIQKGSIRGTIYLTQYETLVQKRTKELDTQAQALYDAGKYNQAYSLSQEVLSLHTDHVRAKQRMEDIDHMRQKVREKWERTLKRKRKTLWKFYAEESLPAGEFNRAMKLIEKRPGHFDELERKINRLVDDLIGEKISVSTYLDAINILRDSTTTGINTVQAKESDATAGESEPKLDVERQDPSRVTTPRPKPPFEKLRSRPLDKLTVGDVKERLRETGAFHLFWNGRGKGVQHQYEATTQRGKRLVADRATGLIWQRSGSKQQISYRGTTNYIAYLNKKHFAGHVDWRVPTLEEAISLMEPRKHGSLYIDSLFDSRQWWIWTADRKSANEAWVVNFDYGSCYYYDISSGHQHSVRAVCWGPSD